MLNASSKPSAIHSKSSKEQLAPNIYNIEKILVLDISTSINPATDNYLSNSIQRARDENFQMLLIKLNTPGGLVSTTKQMITSIGSIKIPTTIWISPEGSSATSAGAILASGAHFLFMAEGSNIGAATPINVTGGDLQNKDLRNKAINDLVAVVESLSESRGRAKKYFAQMITEASSFTAQEALEKNIIDGIVSNQNEIINKIQGKELTIQGQKFVINAPSPDLVEMPWDVGQKLLNVFADPNLAYILLILGAALIYLELQSPGGMIAGVLGTLCLILAGIGMQVLPLNWGSLGLVCLSFILFILEAHVTSYGIISILGLISLLIGSLFLYRADDSYISLSKSLVYSSVFAITIFLFFIGVFIYRDSKSSNTPEDFYSLVGKSAIITAVETENGMNSYYYVKVNGEIWKAFSDINFKQGDSCSITTCSKETMTLTIGVDQKC